MHFLLHQFCGSYDCARQSFLFCACSPLSESADTVGAGMAVPAAQAGCIPMDEVFRLAVTSFKVYDWGLFAARP